MTPKRRVLTASWGLLAIVVVAALAVGSTNSPPPTPAERVRSLSGQFACPVCDGQAVVNSDAAIATQIRIEIASRVEAGQTDDQILSALVNAYGNQYLLTPSASGAASLAWSLPVFLGVLSFAGLGVAFWRWRPSASEVTDDDRELVERAMRNSPADSGDGSVDARSDRPGPVEDPGR